MSRSALDKIPLYSSHFEHWAGDIEGGEPQAVAGVAGVAGANKCVENSRFIWSL